MWMPYRKLVLLTAVVGLGGCGWFETSSSHDDKHSSATVTFNHDEFNRDKAEYHRQAEMKLQEFDARLQELQARAAVASGTAKANLDFEIAKQKINLEKARIEMREIDATAADKWADFKLRSAAAFDDLKKGLDQAVERFK